MTQELEELRKSELRGKRVSVRHGGNNRKALVIREDDEAIYVRFWSRRAQNWDVYGPMSGNMILRKHIIEVETT